MPRHDPVTLYLPFNRDCLGATFVPANRVGPPADLRGRWVIVQDQGLVVDGGTLRPPEGELPGSLDGRCDRPLFLGMLGETACWTTALAADAPLPAGLARETLVPMQGTRLPDDLLSLGGMAMQALHWQSTSRHCPRCGAPTERIPGEWGKRCPGCAYEHYPHLHPAVIVLVKDGDRCLLTRKAGWTPGRYGLVAGFVDNGESLESAVRREVKEEVARTGPSRASS
jgi:NAD+ diphosphatase